MVRLPRSWCSLHGVGSFVQAARAARGWGQPGACRERSTPSTPQARAAVPQQEHTWPRPTGQHRQLHC